jgi:hypothetical protein
VRVTPQKTAIHELISAGSIKLNPVDNEILKTYGQAKNAIATLPPMKERQAIREQTFPSYPILVFPQEIP